MTAPRSRLSKLSKQALRLEELAKDDYRTQIKTQLQALPRPLVELREITVTVAQTDWEQGRLSEYWCRAIVRHWARMECLAHPKRARLIITPHDRVNEPDNLLLRVVLEIVPTPVLLSESNEE